MKTKTILSIFLVLACLYGGVRVFNHFNAWLGIAIIFLTSIIALKQLFKKPIKTQNEKNN